MTETHFFILLTLTILLLYRRNTAWPEIIPLDELYERVSYIVNHASASEGEFVDEKNGDGHGASHQ